MPDVLKYTKPRTTGDLIVTEFDPLYNRETISIPAGDGSDRVVPNLAVLGQVSVGVLSVAAAKVGAGDGAIAGATVAAGTKPGVYVATCIETAANGGVFELEGPDGAVLGKIVVGAQFVLGGVTATIADGATDWAAGDIVRYTVSDAGAAVDSNGNFKWVQVDAAAEDGSQNAAGIHLVERARPVTAHDGGDDAISAAAVRGPMVVRAEELVWPDGATDNQKANWTAQLKALGILVVTSG